MRILQVRDSHPKYSMHANVQEVALGSLDNRPSIQAVQKRGQERKRVRIQKQM
jgi:hypothetical protein